MSYADHEPGYRITSKDQASKWILDEIQNLEMWRQRLDIACAEASMHVTQTMTVGDLRTDFRKFLVRHGSVLGTLVALHRLDQISDEAYQQIRNRATLTLVGLTRALRD